MKKKNLLSINIFLLMFLFGLAFTASASPQIENETPPDNYEMELAVWIPPPPPDTPEETGEEETFEAPDTEEEEEEYEYEEDYEEEEEEEYIEEDRRIIILPPYPPFPPPPAPRPPKPSTTTIKRNYVYKSPNTAMMYSFFIPGMGQFYAEEPGKGMMFLIAEGIFIGMAAYNWSLSDHYQRKADLYYYFWDDVTGDYMNDTMAYHYSDIYENRYKNWLYVEIAVHLLDMLDAKNSAIEYNQRHKLTYNIIHTQDRIGLNLSLSF